MPKLKASPKPIQSWDIDDIEYRLQTIQAAIDGGSDTNYKNCIELLAIATRAATIFRRRELNDAAS